MLVVSCPMYGRYREWKKVFVSERLGGELSLVPGDVTRRPRVNCVRKVRACMCPTLRSRQRKEARRLTNEEKKDCGTK